MKAKIKKQLQTIRRGNVLLCAKGKAQKFDTSMTELLTLVARKMPNGLLVVPYYDTKRDNLWQDLFVWLFKEDYYGPDIKDFYMKTSALKAQGFELYLNGCKDKLPERGVIHNSASLRPLGSTYPALSQQANYNDMRIVPRFNVVEALVNYHEQTGKWLDPYWLESISKEWVTLGSEYVLQKDRIRHANFNFDLPVLDFMPDGSKVSFNFLQEVEGPSEFLI